MSNMFLKSDVNLCKKMEKKKKKKSIIMAGQIADDIGHLSYKPFNNI